MSSQKGCHEIRQFLLALDFKNIIYSLTYFLRSVYVHVYSSVAGILRSTIVKVVNLRFSGKGTIFKLY